MKRKLEDVTDKQVVQTTPENDLAFRALLDKEGFRWVDGKSYISNYIPSDKFYNINTGRNASKEYYLEKGYKILQASEFLNPSKSEILDQHEARISALEAKLKALQIKPEYDHVLSFRDGQVIASEFVPYKTEPEQQPTEPEIKVGMFGAFADKEYDFEYGNWWFGELTLIRDSDFKYRCNDKAAWKHFRPLENPFK